MSKNTLEQQIEKTKRRRQRGRRIISVLLVLAMVTTLGVNWWLHRDGVAMTADYVCGYEEHTHSDACYTKVLSCGKTEHTHTAACQDADGNYICGADGASAAEEHVHTEDCYTKQLTCTIPEHTHTVACLEETQDSSADTQQGGSTYSGAAQDTAAAEANDTASQDENAIAVVSNDSTDTVAGLDLSQYIKNAVFKKRVGQLWQESDSFTTSDQVQGELSFENLYTSLLASNNNTVKIKLPAGINCQKFAGTTYETKDGDKTSGHYQYVKGDDGYWYIVLKLEDDYVKEAGDVIGGKLQFEFQWTEESISKEGETTKVDIGEWSGEIKIEKGKDSGQTEGSKYNLWKQKGSLTYSADGKTAYVDYNITIVVKEDTKAPIELTDTLSSKQFTYDSTIHVAGGDVKVNFGNTEGQGTSTKIQLWPNSGDTVPAGTYTITYRVKSIVDVSNPDITVDSFTNTVTVPDGNSSISSETWTTITTGKINKQGQLVDGTDGTYIDYTVYLNAGDIIKNLKMPASFTDTLPEDLELVGDVTVKQFDVTGTQKGTATATVDGQTITYTTPLGQYYYVITYRSKVKDSVVIPPSGLTVKNEGSSTGGIDGKDESTVVVPSHMLRKSFTRQGLTQEGNNWYDDITWTSKIDTTDNLNGSVYEDWSEVKSSYDSATGVTTYFAAMQMTDAQLAAVTLTYDDGSAVADSLYTIERSGHSSNGVADGLFKITFTGDVTGPVTITYQTRADMSHYTLNDYITFYNYASFTKDGSTYHAQAQTNTIQNAHDMKNVIYKVGGSDWSNQTSGSITLDPGQTSIPWTIFVNNIVNGSHPYNSGELIIRDTPADGLSIIENTISVTMGSENITSRVEISLVNGALTIKVPESVYVMNGVGQQLVVSYRTELPKSFTDSADTKKTFSNTASVEHEGTTTPSTYDQEVIRQMASKGGNYDTETKRLTYNIVLNPDASTLNEGKSLTVQDVLDAGEIAGQVELKSLKLFTAVKTTASKGKTTVTPGRYLQDLTEDTANAGTEFTYHMDAATTFTAYIPDSTAYVLVAEYQVTADVAGTIQMKNKVTITGSSSWSAEDTNTKVEKSTSGDTYTNKDLLTVWKHDAAQYDTLLSGAVFDLSAYTNGTWASAATLTTGSSGTTVQGKAVQEIHRNTLYRLTETQAPEGYVINSAVNYFVVVNEGETATLPDTIAGDSSYSKDKVVTYTVASGKYASVQIDRYDEQDTTIVKEGELRVTKEWIDSSGDTVTDAGTLSTMPDVNVTLTKHSPNQVTVTYIGTNNYPYTMKVGKGATIALRSDSDLGNVTFSGTASYTHETYRNNQGGQWYVYSDIQTDLTVTIPTYIGDWVLNNTVTENAGDTSASNAEVIGTVTLNAANNWSYRWTNLDKSEGVTYTLTEETVAGYTTTYTINGENLEAGASFSLGAKGDKITVTNRAKPTWKLPESGGSGTLWYTAVGIAITGALLLCGYSLRRKRERGRS